MSIPVTAVHHDDCTTQEAALQLQSEIYRDKGWHGYVRKVNGRWEVWA